MAVLDIVKYGNLILRKKCAEVTDFDSLPELVNDMFDTMYEEEGVGLAANQVGLNLNLMIIDVSTTEEAEKTHVFVNGKITNSWGESIIEEGCLSIPEIRLEVKRPEFIKFLYKTMGGIKKEEEFSGLLGRAIQHENDHLNGIFIIDHVSPMVRLQVKKQLKEISKDSDVNRKNKDHKISFVL